MTPPPVKRRTQPHGIPAPMAAPVEIDPEITGVVHGDELRDARARRPTDERIGRLEEKHDEHAERLGKVEVAVAGMGGKLEILPKLVDTMERSITALQQRDHVTFTAKVDVDKAQTLDTLDVKKNRRERLTKAFAALSSGGLLVEILHRLGWL